VYTHRIHIKIVASQLCFADKIRSLRVPVVIITSRAIFYAKHLVNAVTWPRNHIDCRGVSSKVYSGNQTSFILNKEEV
jgi:hypothetical protein